MEIMNKQQMNEAIIEELGNGDVSPEDLIRVAIKKLLEERGWSDPLDVLEELVMSVSEEE